MERYPHEIDIYNLETEAFEALAPYLNRQMAKEYYVYGLDTHDGRIAAAWRCPSEQTAEWVYRVAMEQLDAEQFTRQFQYGYIGIGSCAAIEFKQRGEYRIGFFTQEDFTFAASLTKKPVLVAKKYHCIANDLTDFMCYAGKLLKELIAPNDSNKPKVKPSESTEIPPIIIDEGLIESMEESGAAPPIFIAASGKGKLKSTKSVLKAYSESKPLDEPPDGVIIEGIDPDTCKAIAVAIEREKQTIKLLSIPQQEKELEKIHVEILSEKGYKPLEIATLIYPDADDKIAREKSKWISNYLNSLKKQN